MRAFAVVRSGVYRGAKGYARAYRVQLVGVYLCKATATRVQGSADPGPGWDTCAQTVVPVMVRGRVKDHKGAK